MRISDRSRPRRRRGEVHLFPLSTSQNVDGPLFGGGASRLFSLSLSLFYVLSLSLSLSPSPLFLS